MTAAKADGTKGRRVTSGTKCKGSLHRLGSEYLRGNVYLSVTIHDVDGSCLMINAYY